MASIREAALKLSLIDGISGKLGGLKGALSGLDSRVAALDRSIGKTRGQLFGAAGAAVAAGAALALPVRRAIEFESAMADVRKVVDFESPEAFQKMSADILNLSRQLPMTAEGIADIVAAAGQSGLANDELLEFAEMAAKVGVAWDVSADEAGEALAKLKTALGLSVADTQTLADAINHLGNNTAGSANDILNFTRRVAPMAGQFGLTAEQASAMGAAMIGSGFQAEVAATSFMNMGRSLTAGASATKRQRAAYKELGLDAKQVALDMQKDATGTLNTVLARLREAPAHVRASLMTDIFGAEARALGPLVSNAELFAQALELVADRLNYAGSAQAEYGERAKTTQNNLQLLRNRVTAAGVAFGNVLLPAVNDIAGALGPVIDRIGDFVAANPRLVKAAVAATAALLGLRVAALAGKLGLLLVGRQALVATRGLLSVVAGVGRFVGAAKAASGGAVALQTALAGMSGTKFGGLAKLTVGLRGLVAAVPGIGLLKGALAAVGAVVAGISAPVAAVIAGIAAGGYVIYRYWDRISSVFSGVGRAIGEQLAPALEYVRPVLDWLAPVGEVIAKGWRSAMDALSGFGDWLKGFFAREVLSDSEKEAWADSGYQVATAMIESIKRQVGELVDWFKGLPRRIVTAIGSIDLGGLIRWPSLPSWMGGGSAPAPSPAPVPIDGTRADGGPVTAGRLYLVGERGPELFRPARDGEVIANDVVPAILGGATPAPSSRNSEMQIHAPITLTVNVTGGGEDANALARKVEAVARRVANEALGTLDRQLRRSSDIAFGNIRYGDA